MAATRLKKKLEQGQQKGGKVSGTKMIQLELLRLIGNISVT